MTYELVFRTEAEKDLEDIRIIIIKYLQPLPVTSSLSFLKQWILLKMNLNYSR